jgi:hypothetical protein
MNLIKNASIMLNFEPYIIDKIIAKKYLKVVIIKDLS